MVVRTVTKPRDQLVSLGDTLYYHCICRCVSRAFLCGNDGKQSFEYRRGWIADRIKQLSVIYTIDTAAYAVMSNHYHIVVNIDAERASELSDADMIERWLNLFKAPPLLLRHMVEPLTNQAELDVVNELVQKWRSRLCDISWYMRTLNEHIARKANAEDHCTGHFWESRFKSQTLLDETALLSCMAYVDLNPIRASMAQTPAQSDYTSIQERLGIGPEKHDNKSVIEANQKPVELMAFAGSIKNDTPNNQLPFTFCDYLELVDWTGRIVREDKSGYIRANTPPILQQFNIDPQQWLANCTHIGRSYTSCIRDILLPALQRNFYLAIGPVAKLEQFANHLQQKWLKGIAACRALYAPG